MHLSYLRRGAAGIVLVSLFCLAAVAAWLFSYAESKGPALSSGSVVVTIPHRSSAAQIGHILAGAGLVPGGVRFLLLAKITGYAKKFQAGEFRLTSGQRSIDVMKELSEAHPVEHPVTIPEGFTAEEIAGILVNGGWCDRHEFLRLVHDPGFIRSLDIGEPADLEGYLFPDTYYLTRMSTDAQKIIRKMVRRFKEVWQALSAGKRAGSLSERETVILASIVEKETADPAERPMIAAVFLNRLGLGMRLQSDPTVIYGIKNFSGNLTKEDLQRYTPYNTYLIPALPPGPICNPGKDSLSAVLHPDKEPYLYFVSRNDGTHQFSTTLADHNRAVWKYQKGKAISGK